LKPGFTGHEYNQFLLLLCMTHFSAVFIIHT